ncbi:MAG: hypothetical protein ACI9BO_001838, partial [Zhongshania sp.]
RVYVSGQRTFTSGDGAIGYNIAGLTYEITLPFSVQVDRPLARPMPNL